MLDVIFSVAFGFLIVFNQRGRGIISFAFIYYKSCKNSKHRFGKWINLEQSFQIKMFNRIKFKSKEILFVLIYNKNIKLIN